MVCFCKSCMIKYNIAKTITMKKMLYRHINHIYTYISSYISDTIGCITSFTSRLISSFLKNSIHVSRMFFILFK